MNRNYSQEHLDQFFDKLRSDKRQLREKRYKRWKRQKMAIQKELELDENRVKQKELKREKERKIRRERILERLENKRRNPLYIYLHFNLFIFVYNL